MQRIQFIKDDPEGKHSKGDVAVVRSAKAKHLFKAGVAIMTTAMVGSEVQTKEETKAEKPNGRAKRLRTNKSK